MRNNSTIRLRRARNRSMRRIRLERHDLRLQRLGEVHLPGIDEVARVQRAVVLERPLREHLHVDMDSDLI